MTRHIVRKPKLYPEYEELDAAILSLIEKGTNKLALITYKLRDRPEGETVISRRISVLAKRGLIRHMGQVAGWRINQPTRRA